MRSLGTAKHGTHESRVAGCLAQPVAQCLARRLARARLKTDPRERSPHSALGCPQGGRERTLRSKPGPRPLWDLAGLAAAGLSEAAARGVAHRPRARRPAMASGKAEALEKQHDWMAAAESGNAQRMKLFTQSEGEWVPTDSIPQAVACKAAVRNQEETLKVLLDWGVPLSAKDMAPSRQLLLHGAAGAGAVDCVRLLIKRRVDVNATDGLVKTAMHLALKGSQLGVMKELLRAGATVPLGQKELPLGALNVIKEVQLETQMQEIKGFPTSEKGLSDKLAEADKQVWKSMRAHMQLLERQEEIKVAKVVQDFDEKMRVAQARALEASKTEESVRRELQELKVQVQTEQMKQNQVVAEIQTLQEEESSKKSAEEDIAKDVADKQAELEQLLSGLRAEQEALAKAEAERDAHVEECDRLNLDIEAGQLEHKELVTELADARKELEGLRKDRKRIAELQAEAANLHENVKDDASNAG
ncbi:unnamed protein product [Prorocentrum cordatum]|uniref:Uncharacterized protein n=1 Tax=Prorocentrum cordatum TaxID=2364126 RepID=A0ABN9UUS9_9DINO|nr:unnamed protein product [Polarella glacialis]